MKKFTINVLIATILSTVFNIVLLAIARPFANVPATFSPFQYLSVILFTVLSVITAMIVYMGILKFYPIFYKKIFIWVSVISLIFSFIPDILMPYSKDIDDQGATFFVIVILMIMHVLTAGIVVYFFTKKID
ncbi:MAG: DUF6069 family protein [Candidatus Nomurabacteria bacterium]|nr:DUF6069 family protein [Candidatus Nomurabacteria bacterium]